MKNAINKINIFFQPKLGLSSSISPNVMKFSRVVASGKILHWKIKRGGGGGKQLFTMQYAKHIAWF